jgi:subtilisin family serine protease
LVRSGLFKRLAAAILLPAAACAGSLHAFAADAAPTPDAERRVVGSSIDRPLAASPDPRVQATLSALRAKALAKKTIRVIVGVRASFAAEGYLSAASLKAQRSEIAQVQARVIANLSDRSARSARRFETIPFVALVVDAGELESLAASPDVTDLQEDAIGKPSLAESVPLIRADVAWNQGYTGAGWAIAVLDTGVDKTHPFLAGRVISEACFSSTVPQDQSTSLCPGGVAESTAPGSGANCDSSIEFCHHGTHVAGIAAGSGAALPGVGYSGVAKDAGIVAIQVFSRFDDPATCGGTVPCARAWFSDSLRALEHVVALSGSTAVASVNMSLGGGRFATRADCDSANSSLKVAIDNLRSVGIATVASSGNDGYIDGVNRPACVSSAIGVGNTLDASDVPGSNDCGGHSGGPMATDAVVCSSNTAAYLDLVAPGTRITSSMPGGTYAGDGGTSMAAPHVAGCIALLREAHPTLTVGQILETLRSTGKPVTDWRIPSITTPRIDCGAAVLAPNPALGSFGVSPVSVSVGEPVQLTATVTNRGLTASAPTTIHYMQQIGATWSQVCTGNVEALAPGASTIQRCIHQPPSTPGTYFYYAWINAVAGESLGGDNTSNSVKATVSGALSNTGTALDASIDSGVFGQSVTFMATVTGSSPSGSVTFRDGAAILCDAVALTGGSAPCATAALEVGNHAISAIYGGDPTNAGSISTTLPYAVVQAATRTTIVAHSPNPSSAGAPVTVTASVIAVAPGAGVPSGTITISDGTAHCVISLPATSCSLVPATVGTKALTGSYGGDARFLASVSADVSHSVALGSVGVGVVEYPVSTTNPAPLDITLGPDGNLWFTEAKGSSVARKSRRDAEPL